MEKRYSRLQFKVYSPLKIKDLTYKFKVINNTTQKVGFTDNGNFDEHGFTKWFTILQPNRTLLYEVLYRGEVIQRVSAKSYPKQNNWSVFDFKTTTELTKKIKDNIKEIYLEDGVVGWYLVKKKETMLAWSSRVFKKQLVASDWEVLNANNPHLKNMVPIKMLTPGQVIILSNSTTAKELKKYKSQAQQIENKLETLIKDPKFDPLYFANIYDQLQEIKKNTDVVGVTDEPIKADFTELFAQNLKSDPFLFASKESIDSAVNFNSAITKEVSSHYFTLLKNMDTAKQLKSPESFRRNFYLFEQNNAKEFEALKKASSKSFFAWNHRINFKDNRDMVRKTVFVRAKNFSSIDDYIKNMDETSRVSKRLKWGGRLVFAWDVVGSVTSVAKVYEKGDSDDTRKEILKQTGKINGGLIGARVGGSVGTVLGGIVIGVAGGTVGLPVLVVVGVIGVGSALIGGYIGGVTGQAVVEYGYERLK